MDGIGGRQQQQQQQPCYSSYINLRNVGLTLSSALGGEEFRHKPVLKRSRTFVFGCKHFPEVEVAAKWSCEFCDGAKLIEQASRSNEAVSSLDIDKLLCNYNTSCEGIGETSYTHNAVQSSYNNMGSWILRTRARGTPAN